MMLLDRKSLGQILLLETKEEEGDEVPTLLGMKRRNKEGFRADQWTLKSKGKKKDTFALLSETREI